MNTETTNTPYICKFIDEAQIDLVEAAKLVGVSYQTLTWASRHQKLAVARDPDAEERIISVNVVDLVDYMIINAPRGRRWAAKMVPISSIRARADLQPRQGTGSKVIRAIEDHLRRGGDIEPIWLLPDLSGQPLIVDGHRRHQAAINCQLVDILAIEIELPPNFAVPIARTINQRHGENLALSSMRRIAVAYLVQHPELVGKLEAGKVSQAQLARHLQVSDVALSRALKALRPNAPLDARCLLNQLRPLFGHVAHSQPDDSDAVVRVLQRVTTAIVATWDPRRRADVDQRLKLVSTAVAGSITMEVRALLERRGGDRRQKQKVD
jgi:hypothetical protein